MQTVLLIIIAILSRLVPHPANVTAMGAVALISGSKVGMKRGLLVTVAALVISDLVIGWHPLVWATWGSTFVGVAIGRVLLKQSIVSRVGAASAYSLVFYLITNGAVWQQGILYPKTAAGLIESYIMALPFLRNAWVGDVVYVITIAYALNWLPTVGAFLKQSFRRRLAPTP